MSDEMSFLVECIGFVASAFMTGFVAGRWSKRFENAQNRETIMQTCDTLEQDARKRPLPSGGVIFGNRSPRLSVKYKGDKAVDCDCPKLNRNDKVCILTNKRCTMLH